VKYDLNRRRAPLVNITPDSGFSYIAPTHRLGLSGHKGPSEAQVLEDGAPLPGPANDLHDNIRTIGRGRFSFWHDYVYFSTSDNTDPRANGRKYEITFRSRLFSRISEFLGNACRWGRSIPVTGHSKPVNLSARDSSAEALRRDVDYAVQIGQNYIRLLPDGRDTLVGKTILEIGPGINFGSTLLVAAMGARAMVADRFLSPWDSDYHPKFYTLLRQWICSNVTGADLRALDSILLNGGYTPESVGCYQVPLESLKGIADNSVDIVFSNAVLEHLSDPQGSFRQLARISRRNALGYHQVDFRDHNDFSKPLEYLLIPDKEFEKDFNQRHAERGNRYRPTDYSHFFEASGFRVTRFSCSCFVDESYLTAFVPRLRLARGSRYKNAPVEDLREVSGLFCLERI